MISGATAVNTRVHFCTTHFAHEAAGALGTRHSPRPLSGRKSHQHLGRNLRREIAKVRLVRPFHEKVFALHARQPRAALPHRIFPINPLPTSRVELTLDANLLPSKVVFPQREMRPIRQQTGQRRSFRQLCPMAEI